MKREITRKNPGVDTKVPYETQILSLPYYLSFSILASEWRTVGELTLVV